MSGDIFNAISKVSELIHLKDEMRRKRAQLISVQENRCGNCYHWMKSSCVPEKQHKQFKSCGTPGCNDFILSDSGGFITKFTKEVSDIEHKICSLVNKDQP